MENEWGNFEEQDFINCDESNIILELIARKIKTGVVVDVGACEGRISKMFAEKGFDVFSIEADPVNFERLKKTAEAVKQGNIKIHNFAISDKDEDSLNFYYSEESKGISSLYPFTDNHKIRCTVNTRTLSAAIKDMNIKNIDYLKIDVEGFDLYALKGHNWSIRPTVILCEFEDKKTVPIGYKSGDMADFLIEKGYRVFVSEWHPIVRYGTKHSFKCLKAYPCEIGSMSWGNLLAFDYDISFDEIQTGFYNNIKGKDK